MFWDANTVLGLTYDILRLYLRQFDKFYVSLSIERESKMHYKVYQTRKDSIPILQRVTSRYLHLKSIFTFKTVLSTILRYGKSIRELY